MEAEGLQESRDGEEDKSGSGKDTQIEMEQAGGLQETLCGGHVFLVPEKTNSDNIGRIYFEIIRFG